MRVRPSVLRAAACVVVATAGFGALVPLLAAERASGEHTTYAGNAPIHQGSGLPIPRFASLRSNEVNVRAGPGTRYPVNWVFTRKAMPIEIVAEFENWRKIRDWQGAGGWVLQALLTGKRGFIVPTKVVSLYRTPTPASEVIAKLEPEVMGEIRSCLGDWCRVKVSGSVTGWLERTDLWGVYKSEPIN